MSTQYKIQPSEVDAYTSQMLHDWTTTSNKEMLQWLKSGGPLESVPKEFVPYSFVLKEWVKYPKIWRQFLQRVYHELVTRGL